MTWNRYDNENKVTVQFIVNLPPRPFNAMFMPDVTCAIILKDQFILVTQRSEKMKMPLKWEFPGGKVETGESEEECLIRELKEELNVEVRFLKRLEPQRYAYPDFDIRLIPFVVEYVSGEILLSEHKEYRWVRRDELEGLDWAEADIGVVRGFLGLA